MKSVYLALLHCDVVDKSGNEVVTSITNLDVHDISRSCTSFGVDGFFVVNPLSGQKEFLQRVLNFWETDFAREYNPDRVEALRVTEYAKNLKEVINKIIDRDSEYPIVVSTTAKRMDNQIEIETLRKMSDKPLLLLFGTGGGLSNQVHESADYILAPLQCGGKYNHLSVRSAVAIILDRLLSI